MGGQTTSAPGWGAGGIAPGTAEDLSKVGEFLQKQARSWPRGADSGTTASTRGVCRDLLEG